MFCKSKKNSVIYPDPQTIIEQKLKAFDLLAKQMTINGDEEYRDAVLDGKEHFIEYVLECLKKPHQIENILGEYLCSQQYVGVRLAPNNQDTLLYYNGKDDVAFYFIMGFAVATTLATISIGIIGAICASPYIAVFAFGFLCALAYNRLATAPKMKGIRQEERHLFRLFNGKGTEEPLQEATRAAIESMLSPQATQELHFN